MSADLFAVTSNINYGSGQSVAYTGTAGTITSGLPRGTPAVVVWTTTAAYVKVGVSPTATTADLAIPANIPIKLPVPVLDATGGAGLVKVSAVQISAGGTLYVSPLTS